MATTQFDLVTPTATLYSGQAEMIVCKTVEGEIAFLANHEPYIGALDPCLVRVVGPEAAEAEVRVAVRGGFVEVKDNQVIMLADMAQQAGEIDVAAAQADLASAAERAGSAEEDPTADIDLKWAQARLDV